SRRDSISETCEEAGTCSRVTRDALLMDLHEQRVPIAVRVDAIDVLYVTRGLALPPARLPRARMEEAASSLLGALEGLSVHPGHHQAPAGLGLLDDGRDQSVLVPTQLVGHTHGSTL